MTSLKRVAALLVLLCAAYCGISVYRLARSEVLSRRDTIEDLQAAARLTPGNADLHARIAVIDASRDDELAAALDQNPRAPSLWILRSVRQEQDGDFTGAERSLLRANRVSRYYIPRWSLAAFYYRRGDRAKFEEWARAALSVGYGAAESLYRMAQKLGLSPEEILASVVPADRERVGSYLSAALEDEDLAAARLAAERLLDIGDKTSVWRVLDASDALFRAGNVQAAVALWNGAANAHWVELPALRPEGGVSLAAGAFRNDSLGRGFDWRYESVEGVERSVSEDGSLRLEFSGKQPENCQLAAQNIALIPASNYRVTIRYRLDGISPSEGLRLEVRPLSPAGPLFTGMLSLTAAEFQDQNFEFRSPAQPVPLKLVLAYGRAPGTTRIEGRIWIQSLKLQLIS